MKQFHKLTNLLIPKATISQEALLAYEQGLKAVKESNEALNNIRNTFIRGGVINFEQMNKYEISTAEDPKPYAIGRYCTAYRLDPSIFFETSEEVIIFYSVFTPQEGQVSKFAWHTHEDCDEITTQLSGTAISMGKTLPPFSISKFKAGEKHDYIMNEMGTAITKFTKIKK